MPRELDNWLEHYMALTENTESPPNYHLWSGITAISSALQRKCFCNWGMRGYIYPNLYVVLVGPPGGRKGTAMKWAKGMVQKLKLFLGSDSLGSVQALYNEIATAEANYLNAKGVTQVHRSISIWSEEFQVFISERNPDLITSITDLFDCPNSWHYTALKSGIKDLSNCFITIIGAITPSLLQNKLSADAVGGGLISRIIFVVGHGRYKAIALPMLTLEEEAQKKRLEHDLQNIANMKGPFKLQSDFLNTYAKWYESDARSGVSSEQFVGYNARRALHLNKLCMIFSAAESDEMIITKEHFERGLAVLEYTEAQMAKAFHGFGGGYHAAKMAEIFQWIEERERFSWQELMKKFYLLAMPAELTDFIDTAEKIKLVKKTLTATTIMYDVIKKKEIRGGSDYLNKTLFRRMKEKPRY